MMINTNFSSTSGILTQPNYDNTSSRAALNSAQQSSFSTSYAQNFSQSYPTEFGFRMNERGVLDSSFNRVANIPQSYEINVRSLQAISKELSTQGNQATQIDMPQLVNRYYSTLRAVESEFSTADNAFMSRAERDGLNQGFSTQTGEFDSDISRVYAGRMQLNQAKIDNKNFNTLGLNNEIIDFGFDNVLSNGDFIKPYLNQNGDISKSGLLMNFAYTDTKGSGTNLLFLDAMNLSFASHQQFYEMMGDEGSFRSFINAQNTQTQSFDLYLYMNGVDKTKISDDKLLTLYQRYLGEAKSANMEQFMRTSSVYQLYTQALLGQFNQVQSDIAVQSDGEAMGAANELRLKSLESFANSRKKQANLETIIKSYKSVMES